MRRGVRHRNASSRPSRRIAAKGVIYMTGARRLRGGVSSRAEDPGKHRVNMDDQPKGSRWPRTAGLVRRGARWSVALALLCSVALCTVNFIRIIIQYRDPQVALVVSGTLLLTICMAKSLGCILPILAKILKLDPAIMASPLITTITDAFSILVYFNFALWYLSDRLI